MARWGRRRYPTRRPTYTPQASEAERAQAKQVIIAKVDSLHAIPMLTNITGAWPRRGDVVAIHLDVARGKPKATMFVVPPTAPASMLKTELWVTTGTPPQDAVPAAQFRQLCFYRVVHQMVEWLKSAEPEDEKEVLHYLALFEHQVKDAMRKRTLTVTPQIEAKWRRYKGVRTLYLQPGTEGERDAARASIVRIVKSFMPEMNGG